MGVGVCLACAWVCAWFAQHGMASHGQAKQAHKLEGAGMATREPAGTSARRGRQAQRWQDCTSPSASRAAAAAERLSGLPLAPRLRLRALWRDSRPLLAARCPSRSLPLRCLSRRRPRLRLSLLFCLSSSSTYKSDRQSAGSPMALL